MLVGQFSLIQAFSRHALGVRVDSLYCENSNTSPNPKILLTTIPKANTNHKVVNRSRLHLVLKGHLVLKLRADIFFNWFHSIITHSSMSFASLFQSSSFPSKIPGTIPASTTSSSNDKITSSTTGPLKSPGSCSVSSTRGSGVMKVNAFNWKKIYRNYDDHSVDGIIAVFNAI